MNNAPPGLNEKVWVLHEYEMWSDTAKNTRRVQDIFFIRDGEMRQSRADLGPAIKYPMCNDFRIVALGENTVAEMLDQALAMRSENRASAILAERGPSTLVEDYKSFKDEMRKQRKNQSVLGPWYQRRRNNAR